MLVVGDDNSVQMPLRLLREQAGRHVVAAYAGRHRLDPAEIEDFDLRLLDVFKPGMDGRETMRQFRRQQPLIPIVAIPGRPLPSDAADDPYFLTMATELGTIQSLQQPFRGNTLPAMVATCFEAANRSSSQDAARKIASRI